MCNPKINSHQDLTQNPYSSYNIHPSKSPSSVIVAPALVGNNCHSWSWSFQMVLVSKKKNKMSFLNGSIPVPIATNPLFPKGNDATFSIVINSLFLIILA